MKTVRVILSKPEFHMTSTNVALIDDALLFKIRRLIGLHPKQEAAAIARIRSELDARLHSVCSERNQSIERAVHHMNTAKAVYLDRASLEAEAAKAIRDAGDQVVFKLRVPRDTPAWLIWALTKKGFLEGEDPFGEGQAAVIGYFKEFVEEDAAGMLDPSVDGRESMIARRARQDATTDGDEQHYRELLDDTEVICGSLILFSRLHDMILEYLDASKSPRRYTQEQWWEILVVCRIWFDNEFQPEDAGLPKMASWDEGKAWDFLRVEGGDPHQLLLDLAGRAVIHIDHAASPANLVVEVSFDETPRGGRARIEERLGTATTRRLVLNAPSLTRLLRIVHFNSPRVMTWEEVGRSWMEDCGWEGRIPKVSTLRSYGLRLKKELEAHGMSNYWRYSSDSIAWMCPGQ